MAKDLEKTAFLIKNMHLMDKDSTAYKSGEYKDMFNAAEITSLAKEDMVAYRQSKRYYEDMTLYREAALEEGAEKGRMEGRMEERKDNAKKLLEAGIDPSLIKQILGVSPFES